MFGNLFKPLTEAYIESDLDFDNAVTLESISDFISEYGATSSELICEMYTMSLYSTEVLLENVYEFDNNMISFINEGIVGSLFGLIRKIIYNAYTFLHGLIRKMNTVVDRYSKDNTAWLTKYRKSVEANIPVGRTFTYTGATKWDLSYCTGKKYPNLVKDLVSVSAKVEKALVSTSKLMNNKDATEADFESVKSEISTGFPKGFKDEAIKSYERSLGCKISEISEYYLKKGRGPKGEVQAFRAISPENMLNHIEMTSKLIEDTRTEISTALEETNSIFDILDTKFKDVEDMNDKIKEAQKDKIQNNSISSMFAAINEAESKTLGGGTKVVSLDDHRNKTKADADKEVKAEENKEDQKTKESEKADDGKKDEPASKEKLQEKSIDYMTILKPILQDSMSTWQTTLTILTRISGVRTKLIQEASSEFIFVLTKFATTKFK